MKLSWKLTTCDPSIWRTNLLSSWGTLIVVSILMLKQPRFMHTFIFFNTFASIEYEVLLLNASPREFNFLLLIKVLWKGFTSILPLLARTYYNDSLPSSTLHKHIEKINPLIHSHSCSEPQFPITRQYLHPIYNLSKLSEKRRNKIRKDYVNTPSRCYLCRRNFTFALIPT